MSRVFQVIDGFAYWQTPYSHLRDIKPNTYPAEVMAQMVETDNDAVRESWAYIDGEFIKPPPPEGWLYDDETGTFYQEGELPPGADENAARLTTLETDVAAITAAVERGLSL